MADRDFPDDVMQVLRAVATFPDLATFGRAVAKAHNAHNPTEAQKLMRSKAIYHRWTTGWPADLRTAPHG